MKNILSYQNWAMFTGKEILDWANYQVNNSTSKKKYAARILKYYKDTLNPTRRYYVFSRYETAGCNDVRTMPLIVRDSVYNTNYKCVKQLTVYYGTGNEPKSYIIKRGTVWHLVWCGGENSSKELSGKDITLSLPDSYVEKYFKKV